MHPNYTLIHLHSMLSNAVTNIDSITSYDEYVKAAQDCGMKAMAFTEHGSCLGWTKKKNAIEAAGMKYIHGIEAYVTESLADKIRDNYHVVLLARNFDGVKEINKLSSTSFSRNDGHFYYNPRITFDDLLHTSDNVIVSTACLAGILNRSSDEMQKRLLDFLIAHKDRCFLEIQHHNVQEQIDYNRKLYALSKENGIRLVAGTDTHALNENHMNGRALLQKAKNVHFENEDAWDLTFKTYNRLISAYEKQDSIPMDAVREAIENTNVIADMVEPFSLDKSYKYPHLWEDSEKYFQDETKKGIRERGVNKYPNYVEYKKRINYEYKTYKHNNAIDFILLMDDIIKWCKAQDIQVGYGRGSVNGSVICYLLGITEMDSIKHNLNFERFMNTERVSLADIDTDFPPSRIEEVKRYITQKHGLYCCDIVTFNTIADLGAIRDVCRGLYQNDKQVDYLKLTNNICAEFNIDPQKTREKYPEVFNYVDLVKGTVISIGSHPCGMVVSPIDITYEFGTLTTSTDNYPISQINMKEIDALNYVKLDLLKLDTIEVINNTCKMAGIPRLTPDNIDIKDEKVWNSMRDNTIGIFQWEGGTGNSYIKKLLSDENIKKFQTVNKNVDRMTLLSIGNSAIRPAGASYREDLANGVVRKTGSKPIDEFLSSTFGYLCFQEQIIFFLHLYCGFTMGQADVVRRGFSKKLGTDQFIPIIKDGGYMPSDTNHDRYIKGYVKTMKEKYGISEKKSDEDITAFIQVINDASNYLFSLNHSQPYSYEGYVEAYLRYYYPLEFLTADLNINKDNAEKTAELIKYALSVGIHIEPPKFRYSSDDYYFSKDTNSIYKGLSSIKNIGKGAGDGLYALRTNHYDRFVDLLRDIDTSKCNSEVLDILIKIDFFSEFGDINNILKQVSLYNIFYDKTKKKFKVQIGKDKAVENGISLDLLREYGKESPKTFTKLDTQQLLDRLVDEINVPKCTIVDKIKYQLVLLGNSNVCDSSANNRNYIVVSIDGNGKKVVQLYGIKKGDLRKVNVWNSQIKDRFTDEDLLPIGSVIHIYKVENKYKQKASDEINPRTGKPIWVDDPSQGKEYWLTSWDVIG